MHPIWILTLGKPTTLKERRRLTSVIIARFLVKRGNMHLGTANDFLSTQRVFPGRSATIFMISGSLAGHSAMIRKVIITAN